eukprot:364270-Chlamydomonas_euryale.AAC.15
MDGWMDGWMDGGVDGWRGGWRVGWVGGGKHQGGKYCWVDGGVDGGMDGGGSIKAASAAGWVLDGCVEAKKVGPPKRVEIVVGCRLRKRVLAEKHDVGCASASRLRKGAQAAQGRAG